MSTSHTAPQGQDPGGHGGYETRDVTFRPIVRAAVGMLVVTLLVFALVRWTFGYFAAREATLSPPANPLTNSYGRQIPPEPRLQTAPIQDLRQLRSTEETVLETYKWMDQKAGVVRIPIEQAMELVAQRGLPSRPGTGTSDER